VVGFCSASTGKGNVVRMNADNDSQKITNRGGEFH
jgi:hypothetical protein